MKIKGEGGGGSRLGRWLGAPARALSRACDSYARKMSACAGRMPTAYAGAAAVGGRGGPGPGFMQAASFSSRARRRGSGDGDDDVGELVRALSTQQARGGVAPAPAPAPTRSWTMAAVRIDEDAPCEFHGAAGGPLLPPPAAVRRTRSAGVGGSGTFPSRSTTKLGA